MFHIILYSPQIPPNTGNIIRLASNTGCQLHLIKPLGFEITDKTLRRAGLDYHQHINLQVYNNLEHCLENLNFSRLFAIETAGIKNYNEIHYQANDAFLFGPETTGLPKAILEKTHGDQILKIPMLLHNRSINLSNCVSIVIYEAWRQLNFPMD